MEKNWLIRTQNQKILGPVSKEKIIELIQKKSLSSDDEICPGNGHWFFLREKEFVDQYVLGDLPSPFNLVSEAPSFISGKDYVFIENYLSQLEKGKKVSLGNVSSPSVDSTLIKNVSELKQNLDDKKNKELKKDEESGDHEDNDEVELLPSDSDLEYPDLSSTISDSPELPPTSSVATAVSDFQKAPDLQEASDLDDQEGDVKIPDSADLEYPDMSIVSPVAPPPALSEGGREIKEQVSVIEEKKKIASLPLPRTTAKKVSTPASSPPLASAKSSVPPRIASVKTSTTASNPASHSAVVSPPLPKVQERGGNKTEVTQTTIDPMLLLEIAKSAERSTTVPTRRNDRILVIIFVVILLVIGALFYQYKQMVKKTVLTKQAAKEHVKKKEILTPAPVISPTPSDTDSPSPLLPTEGTSE